MNDQSLKFRDLILRVAQSEGMQVKTVGAADGIPTDASYLQRIKDAINDAREKVYLAVDPMTGRTHSWNALLQTVRIGLPATANHKTIGGSTNSVWIDPSYELFEQAVWTFTADDSSYRGQISFSHEEVVERQIAGSPDQTGCPRVMSLSPIVNDSDTPGIRGGKRLRVWPKPDVN